MAKVFGRRARWGLTALLWRAGAVDRHVRDLDQGLQQRLQREPKFGGLIGRATRALVRRPWGRSCTVVARFVPHGAATIAASACIALAMAVAPALAADRPVAAVDPATLPPDIREPTAQESARVEAIGRNTRDAGAAGERKLAELRERVALLAGSYGPGHPLTLFALSDVASQLQTLSRQPEATPLLREVADGVQARLGPLHVRSLNARFNLVEALAGERRDVEAEALARSLLVDLASAPDPYWRDEVPGFLSLSHAQILARLGRTSDADAAYRRARGTFTDTGSDLGLMVDRNFADFLKSEGRLAEAEAILRAGIEARPRHRDPDGDPLVLINLSTLAAVLQRQGRFPEAIAIRRQVLERSEAAWPGDPERAGLMRDLAAAYQEAGEYAEAEAWLRQALPILEASEGAESPRVGSMTGQLAAIVEALGRLEEALTLRRRELAIDEAAYGPDDRYVAIDLGRVADLLEQRGLESEAEPMRRRALAIMQAWHDGEPHQDVVATTGALAGVLLTRGDEAAAGRLYRDALDMAEALYDADALELVGPLVDHAVALEAQGRFLESTPLIQRSLAITEARMGPGHADTAVQLANLADTLEQQARHAEAEGLRRRALAILEDSVGAGHPDTVDAVAALAQVLEQEGRLAESESLGRRVMDYRLALFGEVHPETATAINNVAVTVNRQGRHAEAEALHRRALAINEALYGPDHPQVATSLNNLAYALSDQGRPVEAEALERRALEIMAARHGDGNLDVARYLSNLGRIRGDQAAWAESETLHRRALAVRDGLLGSAHADTLLAQARLAGAVAAQGRTREAEALARDAVAKLRTWRLQDVDGNGSALAVARDPEGSRDPMSPILRSYLAVAWPLAADTAGRDAASIRDHAFQTAQDLEVSGAARALAQASARIGSGDCAGADNATPCLARLVREQQDLAARVRELDRRLVDARADGNGILAQDLRATLADVQARLASADRQLRTLFPEYADLVSPAALPVAAVAARLQPDEGLLLILPADDDVHVFAVSPTGSAWHRVEGGLAPMAARVATLRCQADPLTCEEANEGGVPDVAPVFGDAGEAGLRAFDRDAAHALYRDLVAPVEDTFATARRLYVVATGPIGGLPLGLLLTEPPGVGEDAIDPVVLASSMWLADRYALTTLPAVSSLRAASAGRAITAPDAFLGVGDPMLGDDAGGDARSASRGVRPVADRRFFRAAGIGGLSLADPETLRESLAPLPGTRQELNAMAVALGVPPARLLLGSRATETAVKREPGLGTARIIAFATHGLLPNEVRGMDEPGLVFTPPPSPTAEDDGVLTASEAAQLSLRAEWVILSACNTAAGDGAPGSESLSGLAKGFLYAGAQALLASHWRVSDDATAALTVETLSAQTRTPGMTRARALQAAMRAVRTGVRDDGSPVPGWTPHWAHPADWAPFVVVSGRDD